MKYRDAKKLHNGDEVQLKSTGEIVTVSAVTELEGKTLLISAMTNDGWMPSIPHTWVK